MAEDSKYWSDFWKKRMSRRRVLTTTGLAGAGLAAAAVVGCGDDDDDGGGSPTAAPSGSATAVASPTPASIPNSPLLTAHAESNPQNLDAHGNQNNSTNASSIMHVTGHGLTVWSSDGDFKPYYAEDFPEVSDDGLTLTYTLKEGLKFSNDKPLDADAALENYEHIRSYSADQPGGKAFAQNYTFDKVDDRTFSVTLETPFAPIDTDLSYRQFFVDMDTFDSSNPVGAGPFILDDWVQNEKLVYVKNPNYFDADRIHFDKMEHIISTDEDAILNAVRTGEWDIGRVPLARLAEFRDSSDLTVVERASGQVSLLVCLNTLQEPWTEPRMREAFEYAIDRNAVNTTVYSGEMYPGVGWLPEGDPFFVPELHNDPRYDLDKARSLVQEAGYDGTNVEIYHATGTGTQPDDAFATYLKQAIEAIGLSVTLKPMEEGALIQDVLFPKTFAAITRYATGRPDPVQLFGAWGACPGGEPGPIDFTNFCNPDFDAAITEATTNYDQDTRYAAYKTAQETLDEGHVYINTGNIKNHAATTTKLKGYKLHAEPSIRFYEDVYREA